MNKDIAKTVFFVSLGLAFIYVASGPLVAEEPGNRMETQAALDPNDREAVAERRDDITVITSHLQKEGKITAIAPNGTLLYYNDTHNGYWDVDPIPSKGATVYYTATDDVSSHEGCESEECIRQIIERVNLTTGNVTVLYSEIDGQYHGSEWHDVDRLGEGRFLVADMYEDRVMVLNTSEKIVEWSWEAQSEFPITSGGPYPEDWVHLNDVTVLQDGRIMVSLRNQDQVVFLNQETGVIDNWTLGAEDEHQTLHEQHNPDYIPEERGGPTILAADSENNRVVEYQRENGTWIESWKWGSQRLQWARDADRLPNGHTLITDTHNSRVIEINQNGNIVWSVKVSRPYEAERLDTGDESSGGKSAKRLGLSGQDNSTTNSRDDPGLIQRLISALIPSKVINGLHTVLPYWIGFRRFGALLYGISGLSGILLYKLHQNIRLRSPFTTR